jgi:hypothetical protein
MSTTTDQIFGGPYYYFKKDPADESVFSSVITLAIMGDSAMS